MAKGEAADLQRVKIPFLLMGLFSRNSAQEGTTRKELARVSSDGGEFSHGQGENGIFFRFLGFCASFPRTFTAFLPYLADK